MAPRRRQTGHAKTHGVHYTPPALASFVAAGVVRAHAGSLRGARVLDPACGEGGLLEALARGVPEDLRATLRLLGRDTDAVALDAARTRLRTAGAGRVDLRAADFLAGDPHCRDVDVVIANPPWVRTQGLGAAQAQGLAARWGLTGRVDLYQAFVAAMVDALREGGTLGLIVPNRFLSTRAGAALRGLLRDRCTLLELFDLGDTRLFRASVLPAVLVAQKGRARRVCPFTRIYRAVNDDRDDPLPSPVPLPSPTPHVPSGDAAAGDEPPPDVPLVPSMTLLLDALRTSPPGPLTIAGTPYLLERGTLATGATASDPWSLSSPALASWLSALESASPLCFADVAHIRVGIKTTADPVFLCDDWDALPARLRPELPLLRPVLTHHAAARWSADPAAAPRRVLYPHELRDGRRRPLDLARYPRARAWLESHRQVLEARTYVLAAGRRFYEIWVPQDPSGWAQPKVVFPDISAGPRFFLDDSGAVVNGDCYWITLRAGVEPRVLRVLLGVANSSLAQRYYDARFHNRLYAGRRRFLMQYVARFPLPDPTTPAAADLALAVDRALRDYAFATPAERADIDTRIDRLVERAFCIASAMVPA